MVISTSNILYEIVRRLNTLIYFLASLCRSVSNSLRVAQNSSVVSHLPGFLHIPISPAGPSPPLTTSFLTGLFTSHQGPGPWKALSQLCVKYLDIQCLEISLKSAGDLSVAEGLRCACTRSSPGSREVCGPRLQDTLSWVRSLLPTEQAALL